MGCGTASKKNNVFVKINMKDYATNGRYHSRP
jgi:hypothetical protein